MDSLSPEEEVEAQRMAEIARRAESKHSHKPDKITIAPMVTTAKFLTKQEREQLALERLAKKREEQDVKVMEASKNHERFVTGQALAERQRDERERERQYRQDREKREKDENKNAKEHDHEVKAIREHYLGGVDKKRKVLKPSEKFAKLFAFDWEADEDTSKNDINPLYTNRIKVNALFGRGYIAGLDPTEQRKKSNFLMNLSEKRLAEARRLEEGDSQLTAEERQERARMRDRAVEMIRNKQSQELESLDTKAIDKLGSHWSEKSLEEMTERDWRIFREDFDIRIKGGRATLPLRYWKEGNFPEMIAKSIADAGYENPSPIQRQAIPIGQARKDIIGIAETGSGKTAAFLIPLLIYMMELPVALVLRVADEGPLAVVMAPTRELAQQIEEECIKLARYTKFKTACIVGGQSIEEQGFILRKGVEIVIGTPGRMVDCIENNYLVLNQCNYVVLDEADRMVSDCS
jgi:ATP-dependent RNA helicase DDX23/PRP28